MDFYDGGHLAIHRLRNPQKTARKAPVVVNSTPTDPWPDLGHGHQGLLHSLEPSSTSSAWWAPLYRKDATRRVDAELKVSVRSCDPNRE